VETFESQELRALAISQQAQVAEDGERIERYGNERSRRSAGKGN